jgi:cell division protein FtsL
MTRILRYKRCLVIIIFFVIFSAMSSCVSFVQARQPTVQEKSLQLLDDVADINLAAYSSIFSPLQSDSY